MPSRKTFKLLLIVITIFVNISCDQVSKKIVRRNIAPNETIELINHHVSLTNVENPGAFLSLGTSLTGKTRSILLSVLPLMVMIVGLAFLMTSNSLSRMQVFAFSLIIGGGLGNVADRMLYGSVTDFLHIDFGIFQTGIFNMADVSIMTGCGLIVLQGIANKFRRAHTIS